MKRNISLSIFFPAYNEEDNIASTVRQAENVAKKITDTYEIIIVNDGSKDKTGDIAERLARENPRIRALHHYGNKGYGAAVWDGIQAARYDWVFFTDADLQFRLEEMMRLVDFVPEYQVVLGYRAPRRDPFLRLVNAWGWNKLNRLLFGLRVKDIDCAFKLFDRRLVSELPVKSRGAMMSAELLVRLSRRGVTMKEVPVTHLPRVYGVATGAKPSVIVRAFKELYWLYKGDLGQITATFQTYVQAVKFGLIGLINTAVDLMIYYTLTRSVAVFTTHLVSAKILSFMVGTVCSFLLNRRYTFNLGSPIRMGEVLRFYSTVGVGLAINAGSLYLFHNVIGIHDLISVGIATVITFLWGFFFSKFWVFNRQPSKLKSGVTTEPHPVG